MVLEADFPLLLVVSEKNLLNRPNDPKQKSRHTWYSLKASPSKTTFLTRNSRILAVHGCPAMVSNM